MLYYFDETADQGYVEKTSSLEEYGLLAGWAFPDCNKATFEAKFAPILSSLSSRGYKKLHCTEIFKDDANSTIRDSLYNILLSLNEYVIIHEGAYPLGVRQQEQVTSDIFRAHPPAFPDHIKVKKSKGRTRLYVTLLAGIIIKLEECAIKEGESDVHMISDRIDEAMRDETAELLAYLSILKHPVVAKAYDMLTKQQLTRTYEIETTSATFSTKIERVKTISYADGVTPLTFVADFICFELLRHFRRRMKAERPIKFQCPEVLDGFPLKDKIGFPGSNYFTDIIFRPRVNG